MNRRTLLGVAVFLPAATLFACKTQTPSQIASDVNLIASGLAAAINDIKPNFRSFILNTVWNHWLTGHSEF
jgi:hypothetical protein